MEESISERVDDIIAGEIIQTYFWNGAYKINTSVQNWLRRIKVFLFKKLIPAGT